MELCEGDGYDFCCLQSCIESPLTASDNLLAGAASLLLLLHGSTNRANVACQLHKAFLGWHNAAELSELRSHTHGHGRTVSLAWYPQCLV